MLQRRQRRFNRPANFGRKRHRVRLLGTSVSTLLERPQLLAKFRRRPQGFELPCTCDVIDTPIVGIFANESAIVRSLGAVLREQNDVFGPRLPCKGFRRTTTEALSEGAAGPDSVFADRRPDK